MNQNTQENLQVINVPIEEIIPNRFQPRLNFDESALNELASSIKEHGIIQPLILRRLEDKYEIIAGERRFKAAKMAGLMSVPAIITKMDDNKSAEVAIVENVQRKDLSAIEEAKSYKALLDKGYLTQEELAKKMGLSQSAISNKLRLLSLSDAVQDALMDGKISERHARSLLQLSDSDEQEKWLKTIIDERLTVKDLDKKLKDYLKNEEKSDEIPLVTDTPDINNIKENATDIFSVINQNNESKNDNINITSNNENTTDDSSTNNILNQEKPNKVPNKFFNFLEDESVNMDVGEETNNPKNINPFTINTDVTDNQNNLENQQNSDLNVSEDNVLSSDEAPIPNKSEDKSEDKIEEKNVVEVIEPNLNVEQQASEEEIEMLDFLGPVEEPKIEEQAPDITQIEEVKEVDLTNANELIDKLEDDLRENNYRISISKENDLKEMRYIITIDKE